MKKRIWKIEYSITLLALFAFMLFMIPTSFSSKGAMYISKWNEAYNKIDYMFSAMSAQADSDIVKGLKNATTNEKREHLMIMLVKPYLRLYEANNLIKNYKPQYMNGKPVDKKDFWHFDKFYKSESGLIVGIKDIENENTLEPAFMMLVDMNGIKAPNTWGRDIYGVDIYADGKVRPLGYNWEVDKLKKDCSSTGTGISCSHFYRIGGEFRE